jgi:hypothetical protein
LNDPVFYEAAQALGARMQAVGGGASDKLAFGFRLCLARPPRTFELRRLVEFYEGAKSKFDREPEQAMKLATANGKASSVPAAESAAFGAVGNVLLNLDETLMRP